MQEVVNCLEVEEIPESLLIDMGTLQYRSTLLTMIEKVRSPFAALCFYSFVQCVRGRCMPCHKCTPLYLKP